MDFRLSFTPEQETFREEVRGWLEVNVPEGLNRRPRSPEESYELYLRRRELGRKLGARGWLFPAAPREFGGGGLNDGSVALLLDEMHRLGLDLPPYYDSGMFASSTIEVWGTEEQKRRFLPPIYRGEVRTWQLLTEPQAGSDLAAVRLSARRDGDEWVLNGQKMWVGSAHGVDRFWLIARTEPQAPRHQNLSWFMIDADLPGISTRPQAVLAGTGEGGADEGHKNSVFFDDVRVPANALVGGENNGWRVASTHLEVEHGGLGAVFRKDHTWEQLLAYCKSQFRNGRPLLEHDDVRDGLAEIYIRTRTVDLLGRRNFWLRRSGQKQTYESPQFIYLTKTTGLWLTQAILDILGPAALTYDDELGAMEGHAERQAREGIVGMHPGGTADIQRVIIARRLGIGDRQPERAAALSQR